MSFAGWNTPAPESATTTATDNANVTIKIIIQVFGMQTKTRRPKMLSSMPEHYGDRVGQEPSTR